MKNISRVILLKDKNIYLVEGEGIPLQMIEFDDWDDWNTVYDAEGECAFDVQIYLDDDDGKPLFQYAGLIRKDNYYDTDNIWLNVDVEIIQLKELNYTI
jgi:hypothetical protein